jgi:hypothetical protein
VVRAGYATFEKAIDPGDGQVVTERVTLTADTQATPRVAAGGAESSGRIYGGVAANMLFEPAGTQTDICSAPGVTKCGTSAPLGGGLFGYAGYRIHPLSLEALVGFQVDLSTASGTTSGMAATIAIPRLGGLFALRARMTWQSPEVRWTVAAGFGAALRDVFVISLGIDSTTYLSPAVNLEGGVQFRFGPTTALSLGLLFWGENAGGDVLLKVHPLTKEVHGVASTQAFFMPFLGIEFGP